MVYKIICIVKLFIWLYIIILFQLLLENNRYMIKVLVYLYSFSSNIMKQINENILYYAPSSFTNNSELTSNIIEFYIKLKGDNFGSAASYAGK